MLPFVSLVLLRGENTGVGGGISIWTLGLGVGAGEGVGRFIGIGSGEITSGDSGETIGVLSAGLGATDGSTGNNGMESDFSVTLGINACRNCFCRISCLDISSSSSGESQSLSIKG